MLEGASTPCNEVREVTQWAHTNMSNARSSDYAMGVVPRSLTLVPISYLYMLMLCFFQVAETMIKDGFSMLSIQGEP